MSRSVRGVVTVLPRALCSSTETCRSGKARGKTCNVTLESLRPVAPAEEVEESFGDRFVDYGEVPRTERLLADSAPLAAVLLRKTGANRIVKLTSASGPPPASVPPNGPARGHSHPAIAAMTEVYPVGFAALTVRYARMIAPAAVQREV
jgi:hypothetical protein